MPIVGVNITKLSAERKEAAAGNINIDNNVSLIGLEDKELSLGSEDRKGLRFKFKFTCSYKPDLGNISMEGHILYIGNKKEVAKIKADWEKSKKVEESLMKNIMSAALAKSNILSIKTSDEIGLPSPIPLPKIKK